MTSEASDNAASVLTVLSRLRNDVFGFIECFRSCLDGAFPRQFKSFLVYLRCVYRLSRSCGRAASHLDT